MKRLVGQLLCLVMMLSAMALPAVGAVESKSSAVELVQALGIMVGDSNGNLNLSAPVTRAEFSKMLVAASAMRDTVGGSSGFSLFKDVKKDHWAVEYIKVTAENGWFVGYLDGTFRPNQSIALEEAATAVLRLLGYENTDLTGSYPTAQISKFKALGLHDGFSTQQGQLVSREDCANIFYNLMSAKTKTNAIYGQSLGYELDGNGQIDYSALVNAQTSDPFVVGSEGVILPFDGAMDVFRHGKKSTIDAAQPYDVYYYNENLRTVWIYNDRVTGTYTSASPNTAAPTSVRVRGVDYAIASSAAAHALSTQGKFSQGDTVTLLLGMNGGVVDVMDAEEVSSVHYGVVTGEKVNTIKGTDGVITVEKGNEVACTNGQTYFIQTDNPLSEGVLAQLDFTNDKPISNLQSKSLVGKVSADGDKIGQYYMASDIEILEVSREGGHTTIFPQRMAGTRLEQGDVRFYMLNGKEEITHLILEDVTGDAMSYGLLTDVVESTSEYAFFGQYHARMGEVEQIFRFEDKVFSLDEGGAVFKMEDGQVTRIENLPEVDLNKVSNGEAFASNRSMDISDDVQVYLLEGGKYHTLNLHSVSDTNQYELSGYYDDNDHPAGGIIRIIVAKEID